MEIINYINKLIEFLNINQIRKNPVIKKKLKVLLNLKELPDDIAYSFCRCNDISCRLIILLYKHSNNWETIPFFKKYIIKYGEGVDEWYFSTHSTNKSIL